MITFRPMTPDEFAKFRAYFVPDYAEDLVANHGMTQAQALAKAAADVDQVMPDGVAAKGHSILSILDPDGVSIGYLCYEAQSDGQIAYINDFHILPAFQGQGHAKAAMLALDQRAKAEGFVQVKLRVAPDNDVARHVYDRVGFRVSGIQMVKPL